MNDLMMRRKKPWTDEEIEVIETTRHLTAAEVALMLGRTKFMVNNIRGKLGRGWEPLRVAHWTDEELEIIRAHPYLTSRQLEAKLPGRTWNNIRNARQRFDIPTVSGQQKNPNAIGKRTILAKTCPKCGLLLSGDWFRKGEKAPQHTSYCNACRRPEHQRARDKRRAKLLAETGKSYVAPISNGEARRVGQAMTLPHATRHFQHYTEADYAVLRRDDMTVLEKALALRRTYVAVQNQCVKNGFKNLLGKGDPSESQWIIDNPNADNIEVIAALIQERNAQVAPASAIRPEWDWDDEVVG